MTAPSPRQRRVLQAVLETGCRKEAARTLGISEHTVRGHLARLYADLDAGSAIEAAARIAPREYAQLVEAVAGKR